MKNITQVTDQTFRDTISFNTQVVLYYFGTECGPCKGFSPVFERVAADYVGKAVFGKINTDEFSYLPVHEVRSLPTIVVIVNGQVVDKMIGSQTEQAFRAVLQKHIN